MGITNALHGSAVPCKTVKVSCCVIFPLCFSLKHTHINVCWVYSPSKLSTWANIHELSSPCAPCACELLTFFEGFVNLQLFTRWMLRAFPSPSPLDLHDIHPCRHSTHQESWDVLLLRKDFVFMELWQFSKNSDLRLEPSTSTQYKFTQINKMCCTI